MPTTDTNPTGRPSGPASPAPGDLGEQVEEARVRLALAQKHIRMLQEKLAEVEGLSPRGLRIARSLTRFYRTFTPVTSAVGRLSRGEVGRAASSRARVAIVNTPRSGSTWLRSMLAMMYDATPMTLSTHEVYDWNKLPRHAILHMHERPSQEFREILRRHHFRPLALIRHPLDTLVSILQFTRHEPRTRVNWGAGEGGDEWPIVGVSPLSPAFLDYATGPRAEALLTISLQWWNTPGIPRVRYEDLTADTTGELMRLAGELGLPPRREPSEVVAAYSRERSRSKFGEEHVWNQQTGTENWKRLLSERVARPIAEAHRVIFEQCDYTFEPDPELTDEEALANWRQSIASR